MRRVPFFRALDRVDLARLIGALEKVHALAGTLIFPEGAEADALYLLESGKVVVSVKTTDDERPVAELEAPAHFGELGLLLDRRTGSVRAITDVHLWKLPRQRFERLVQERPSIGLAIAASLAERLDQRSREHVGAPIAREVQPPMILQAPPVGRPLAWRIVGAAIAVGVPLVLWPLDPPHGLSPQGWHVGLVVLGAALAWLFEPLPDFVVALAMVTAWGLFGLVPLSLAFAGFASSTWLIALGALGLASAMARSGLLFRIALFLLRTFPSTHFGQVLALLVGGVLTTPLVPLAIARVATIAPIGQELAQGLGYAPRSRASAALSFAGLIGHGAFSSVFLTGMAMNFFVIGLLSPPDRARIDWLTWFAGAALVGGVTFVGAAVVLQVLFRPEGAPKAMAEVVQRQQRVMGPLSRREQITIAALAVLMVGLLLQPVVHVDIAWLAIAALVLAAAGNVIDRENFRGSIDWGFLLLFGILLGTAGVLRSVGVDRWIADSLVPATHVVGNPGALIVLLGAFVIVCRLVLPWIPATLLLSLALVPAAPSLGLSPWVVGFVVLVSANTWLHPSQSDFCRLTRDATRGEMFTERHGLILGIAMTLLTLVAIAASVPYWRAIGLLSP